MKCKELLNQYLSLDNQVNLPILLRLHVFFCHTCREEVEQMEGLLDRMKHYTDGYPAPNMTDKILSLVQVIELEPEGRKTTPIRYWLTAGALMVLATIVIQFAKPSVRINILSSGIIELPLNIICCAGLTIFIGVFIGSHLEEVSKFFKIHRSH